MMLGIAVADVLNVDVAIWLHLSLFALLLMVAGLFIGRLSLLFGVGALLSMFSIGATLMSTDDGYSMPQWNETKGEYSAVFISSNVGMPFHSINPSTANLTGGDLISTCVSYPLEVTENSYLSKLLSLLSTESHLSLKTSMRRF